MARLSFGMGLWWAGDGGGWMHDRLSAIVGGYGGIIMESLKLFHPQRCCRWHQHRKGREAGGSCGGQCGIQHPQRCARIQCQLVGVCSSMENEH